MTLRDIEAWDKTVAAQSDDYGKATIRYAEQWARLMEARIANGDTLEACAQDAAYLANNEGVSWFMYGCAVGILAQCWIHGEQLRRWHNLRTQIHDEGERANESGTVLNPALLTVSI